MRLKKLLPILSLALLIAACSNNKAKRAEALNGIPSSASVIFEVNRFDKFYQGLEKSGMIELASEDAFFNTSTDVLATLAEKTVQQPELRRFFEANPFFLSLHMIGTNHSSFLFTRGLGNQGSEWDQIANYITSNFQGAARNYDNASIFKYTIENIEVSFCSYRGVLFISPQEALIEDGIRQINSEISLANDAHFTKLRSTANKKDDANIYFQYGNCPDFVKLFFPKTNTNWIGNIGKWTELDLVCKDDGFLMNGLSISNDSSLTTFSVFQDNDPQRLTLFEVAPKNTSLAILIGVDDFQKYHKTYKQKLRQENQLVRYIKNTETIGKVDFVEEHFISWIEKEAALFVNEASSDIAESSFAIMKAKDQQLAIKHLEKLSSNFKEAYRGYSIYQIAYNSLFETQLGDVFEDIKKPFYTALDDNIVFANSLVNLRGIINAHMAKSTLGNDTHFRNFYDHLNPRSNVFVYAKNPGASKLFSQFNELKIDKGNMLAKASAAAIQFSSQKNLAYTNAFVFLKENSQTDTRINWTAQLDTNLLGQPHIVTNHYNGKKEVIVQDINHELYHFDTYGQLLWKRNIGEAIMGDVHLVDMFKNNKYQFLFNTAGKIYLLDRKGRNVEAYPIKLKEKATLPLALFDFDKNRRYRIAQVCGKKVYYYNIEGKIVSGWKFTETNSNISMTPQHFAAYGKDFILFPEENGKVNILNRQGTPRVKPDYNFNLSSNKFYLEKEKKLSNSKLITTGDEGQFYYIFMNDKIDVMRQEVLSANHFFAQKEDLRITYDQGTLKLESADDVYRYDFNGTPNLEFVLPENSKSIFIAAVDAEKGKIYAFDRKAELIDGFPIYGTSLFHIVDLDKDGKLNLIVGSKEGSVYNYSVE